MKIKQLLPTICFYIVSAVCLFLLCLGIHSPISSLIVLIVFSISLYVGSLNLQKEYDKHTIKIMQYTFLIMFIVYSVYIISLLFVDSYFGRDQVSEIRVNLIPFKTIILFLTSANEHTLPTSSIITNLLGNLIAFMPLGFYLPLFFKPLKKLYVFLPSIILLVAIIEALQLAFKCGSCDIDDLILNVLGALIFFLLANNKKVSPIIKSIVKF